MRERLETLKYTFTVEGETEQWYLFWLRDQINGYAGRTYNVAFDKVQEYFVRTERGKRSEGDYLFSGIQQFYV